MTRLKLQLDAPVRSVRVLTGNESGTSTGSTQIPAQHQNANFQIDSLCSALQQAISDFQQLHENLFLSHKEQIIRLSIEIAGKILAKDIQDRNYEIEKVITEALATVDVPGDITIRLNPEDMKSLQKAVDCKDINLPEKAVFVDDSAVHHGECIIDTNNGTVEYLIQEHLSMIENALLGMHTQTEQV